MDNRKTPTSWKQSNTILLYKKDDSLDIGNYRPIALSNAIYKLWTSTITEVLSTSKTTTCLAAVRRASECTKTPTDNYATCSKS